MHNVLVVDKKGLCGGMTAKSGALVRMHYTNEPEARMAFASLRYFQRWATWSVARVVLRARVLS